MKRKIDLHIHSNHSEDADLSVEQIFTLAEKLSISAISITDHDSIDSIPDAFSQAKKYSVEYIPGVEITTVFPIDNSQQHILGYFIDQCNPGLIKKIKKIKNYRIEIGQKRNEALMNLGFFLDEKKIQKMTGERPPTATSTMIELFKNKKNSNDKRLYVYLHGEKKNNKIKHFYNDYFTEGKPAYVPFKSISVQECTDIIKEAGGIPVIAHPVFIKNSNWLNTIVEMGIMGIEAVSTYHSPEEIEFYCKFANKNNLLITSGSDFHGPTSKPNIKLGKQKGMHYSYLQKMKDFIGDYTKN